MEDLGKPHAATEQPDVPPNHEDALLVSAVLRRDRKATAEFVARYSDDVYRYVKSRLWPRDDLVNDIVQEIFLAAWERLSQYRGTGPLQAWLVGIARHKVEAYYRAQVRAPEPIDDLALGLDTLKSGRGSDRLEQEQMQKKTWQVMSSLPELYRLVLIWRYWDKASAREMAAKTGKTEKAIERLLARARAEFRERWNS